MSGYIKKIIILSQTAKKSEGAKEATGILKLEKLGGRVSGRAAIFNLSHEGLYVGIKCKNLPLQAFALCQEPETVFSLHSASEIEDAVCLVARESATGFVPVLTGAAGRGYSEGLLAAFSRSAVKNPVVRTVAEKTVAPQEQAEIAKQSIAAAVTPPVKEPLPLYPVREPFAPQSAAAQLKISTAEIDDERIAEDNYFERHRETAAALEEARRFSPAADEPQEEIKAEKERHAYYKKISGELERLFSSFPPEETLAGIISGSYFARISYVGEKYYAVGLITSGDEPQYICYAVPGEYSSEPPAELRGSCKWLPAKNADLRGAGYWVMYQDTDTGATITDIV